MIKINDIIFSEFELSKTYGKTTVLTTDKYYILKSYQSYICLFDKVNQILISNVNKIDYSQTTKKHYNKFKELCKTNYEIKTEIYICENDFLNILNELFKIGSVTDILYFLIKRYEKEKEIIKYVFETDLKENNLLNYELKETYKITIDKYKTRTKEKIFYTYQTEFSKIDFLLITTYNKNKTKLINYQWKIISNVGLSFKKV